MPNDSLESLAGLAASTDAGTQANIDAEAPVDPNAPPPPPPPDVIALDLVNGFAGLVVSFCPDAGEVWTMEARQASAAVLAPLAEKYSWNLTAIPIEVTAAMIVGPLLWRTSKIVALKLQADRDAKAAKLPATAAPAEKRVAAVAAAAEDGSPAAAVHPQMALYKS